MGELLAILSLNWPAAICFVLGFGFVVWELFAPGFGAPGITGLALLLIGVVLTSESVLEGILWLIIIVIVLCLLLAIFLRSASKGKLSKTPLVLSTSMAKQEGFTSGDDLTYFLGREGVATSTLRPAGSADFDGVKLDVVSEAEFIEKGVPVRIVRVEGRRIVVRPAEET